MTMNKIMKKILNSLLTVACMAAFMAGSMTITNATKSNLGLLDRSKAPGIDIMLGKAEMITIDGAVSDVLVADPSIVDVMAVKSNKLYMVGSALGDTNVMALDADGNILKKINIHVQMDTDRIDAMVRELYPDENVNIQALTDQVVLTGEVSNPAVSNKIATLIANYAGEIQGIQGGATDGIIVNMMAVRGEQQIMLRVKIVEVARSALKDLGLGLDGGNLGTDGGAALNSNQNVSLTSPVQLANAVLNYNSGTFGALNYNISALEREGIVNTLAEPNLTAISGEQAGFLAGGEFPIPTQIDENGNLVYEFRPFGVSLNFRPIVMSKERISLQLTTEVSTATFDQNLQLNGINVPTFNVRRAETTVELPSGGTLMIAGLIRSDSISGMSGLPGVADVPVVGDLIKSDTFQRNETELLVMITPYMVEPFAQSRAAAAVTTAPESIVTEPTQTYGAMQPDASMNQPISMKDLPIEPVSLPSYEPEHIEYAAPQPRAPIHATKQGVPRAPNVQKAQEASLPIERQQNKANGVFQNNIENLYGDKTPKNLLQSMSDFGYVLD